ncbi:hypothetical protein [Aquimarina litoralis]|uniref:hypothetical protein n=1 Tax=Aquimarina litoralis TaxID=584605 RepID=UPI001C56FC56|nr:hypothetical protein [Aquimarina litoralis]MBW1297021.1 hypothetical protein [Aquimarina litoralis]
MSFLKSAINQVGRDVGKVVSNSLFKDSHAAPYRRVTGIRKTVHNSLSSKTEFEKAIDFQTGHRPSTLIAKISGVYTIIKNKVNEFLSDGYLDTYESEILFEMMQRFNSKVDDICDLLEIDETSFEKEINQLTKIVEKTNTLFQKALQLSSKGCQFRKMEHLEEADKIKLIGFFEYVGFNIIWMGNYARGKQKSMTNTVLANIADILTCTWPLTRSYLLLEGILTFSKESNRRKKIKNAHLKLAEIEGKRGELYSNI